MVKKRTFLPTKENVREIGRTLFLNDILWLALSGTGLEFKAHTKKVDLLVYSDDSSNRDILNNKDIIDTTHMDNNKKDEARVAVYGSA